MGCCRTSPVRDEDSLGSCGVAVLLVSCGTNASDRSFKPFGELMRRPDIDQATQRYQQMYSAVRAQLTAAFPSLRWVQVDQLGSSECGAGFPGLGADGEARTLPNWSASVAVPGGQWDRAVGVAEWVVRGYGFDSGPIAPGGSSATRFVAFYDQYRAEFTFTVGKHTGLLLVTGVILLLRPSRVVSLVSGVVVGPGLI
jgi:Lipoprotein confined to pathogenic Mycobacterium